MPAGIPYDEARKRYRPGSAPAVRSDNTSAEALLKGYHPDHGPDARVALAVGVNRGDSCQPDLARHLQANALIDDVDIAGAQLMATDVLVIGGGGGGCAAALTAAKHGARVILATKLRLGDSNTVMAEGGIQAAIGEDDSPQLHFEDTLRAGHFCGDPALVAQMVMDGPDVIRWLIQLGMMFDQEEDRPIGGNLLRKKPGGASAARILSYRDYTGLEMMRVLREAVDLDPGIEVWNRCPAVELLSDERGNCAGGVIYNLESRTFVLVRAAAVIIATGGAGRLHLNSFPTSNHFGATADGLVLAYRIGARLRELDSFQYHPTGIAYPPHLAGGLISEAARSAGAKLINGEGERFVDELKARDIVASAILRECAQGRGIIREGQVGVLLDTPTLEMEHPGILDKRLVTLSHLAHKCGHDAAKEPFLVYPTLHYQNGGVAIDGHGTTSVSGLYCVGEVAGGIHGRNRLMGNALLDILSMGRRAGASAAEAKRSAVASRAGIGHVHAWQRELTLAGLPLHVKAPILFPGYAHFDLRVNAGLRAGVRGRAAGGVR
ncbi:FAD-binding protein [Cupriavidus metallidurans]|uniref:FAD-binding protein n=1 Tax=Cupriavidus metallidurans TaxID=119219 RepID=UPI001CC9012C|nr:FAD-binding protein [Cupriavidus metallidurans]UBM07639.1 FAD-binding protein [Cupriavidus metallidurans]